ncbi:ABC transporter ATP-binding protein [Candidatus Nomurabacteria bacterium]|nr:ABC transporter ATP-binding protein [Candidatus Nomurabacteria bacterium]
MTNSKHQISVQDLVKRFKVPIDKPNSLRGRALTLGKLDQREFLALDKVSFGIKRGEFVGIVGKNGSGKSTLLKLIAGIYQPSSGKVKVRGHLIPFIELGVGFNLELTGRENVYLNATLMGLSHQSIDRLYDQIVEFAELGDFMEQKLKNYSSGMQVRLAFSIAIRANADILLIDEVLAVGDSSFQQKCLDYFYQVKQSDTTVILVTHDMSIVEQFCDRAILLDQGKVSKVGSPKEISLSYQALNFGLRLEDQTVSGKHHLVSNRLKAKNDQGDEVSIITGGVVVDNQYCNQVQFGQSISLRLECLSSVSQQCSIGIGIYDSKNQYLIDLNSKHTKRALDLKKGRIIVDINPEGLQLNPGKYRIAVGVYNSSGLTFDYVENLFEFIVLGAERWGLISVDSVWELNSNV